MSRRPLAAAVVAVGCLLVDILPAAAQNAQPLPNGQVIINGRLIGRTRRVPVDPKPALTDQQALEAARLKPDDADGLLSYFRQRTLSDTDLARIQAVIKRLGADDFDERLKAANEVEGFGPAAVGPLRAAAQANQSPDKDPEIGYRARESLARMEKVPHAAVARAAVRAVAKLKPADAVKVLLGFLPLADDETVADEIRDTLTDLAVRDGKADPALVAALTDPAPVRRAAAAVALLEGGRDDQAVRIPDAFPKVQAAAKAEADTETRFQMLYALLTVARDRAAVEQLIDLLPELPRGRLWQAEDYLLQLAGKDAPKAVFGKDKAALNKARDAWKGWWAGATASADLARFDYVPRIAGKSVLVLMDFRFGSMGSVVELGPDMKERWRIAGLNSPMDARFQPDGTVVIAEHNSNRITVRDPRTGKIVATRTIGGANRVYGNPQQVQVLDNGNLLVVCRNVIVEFKKDKDEEEMRFVRNNYDVAAAHRLPDGTTAVFLQNGPNHCVFLDAKGKEIPNKTLKTQMPYYQAHTDLVGKDRLLVTEMQRVVEYDLKDGKVVWSRNVSQPRSVQRLPNGNTLLVDGQGNKAVEVTEGGEEVWSYTPPAGFNVFRAFRR